MRRTIIMALLLMPAAVFADALATCATVFDAATFRAMTATNDIQRVAGGELFTKSVFHTFFGSKGQGRDDITAEFSWEQKQYRLHIRRQETKTIYTILLVTANKPTQVVAVGEIQGVPLSKEVKDDPKGDPFIVVVRTGNYLKH